LDSLTTNLCDADYAGDMIERKSTSGKCNVLFSLFIILLVIVFLVHFT